MGRAAQLYAYRAQLVRVVDADTIYFSIDLGLRLTYQMDVRLRGCNAAEKATPEGQAATAYVTQWLTDHATDGWFKVITHKNNEDPHGRWLAEVLSLDGLHDLADDLIAAGHAVAWDGSGKKPVPVVPGE